MDWSEHAVYIYIYRSIDSARTSWHAGSPNNNSILPHFNESHQNSSNAIEVNLYHVIHEKLNFHGTNATYINSTEHHSHMCFSVVVIVIICGAIMMPHWFCSAVGVVDSNERISTRERETNYTLSNSSN